jgi:hypothetical protein
VIPVYLFIIFEAILCLSFGHYLLGIVEELLAVVASDRSMENCE